MSIKLTFGIVNTRWDVKRHYKINNSMRYIRKIYFACVSHLIPLRFLAHCLEFAMSARFSCCIAFAMLLLEVWFDLLRHTIWYRCSISFRLIAGTRSQPFWKLWHPICLNSIEQISWTQRYNTILLTFVMILLLSLLLYILISSRGYYGKVSN